MDRTGARAAAMKLLYEWEMGGDGGEDTRLGLLQIQPDENETEYMEAAVEGVKREKDALDALISRYLVDWSMDRVHKVDLSILRLGAYEICHRVVPGGVAVNEAVALAHAYSTPEAGAFINGVLGSLLRERERK